MLITGGMGLAVLGLQQSSVWGWGDADDLGLHRRSACAILAAFVRYELRIENPLLRLRIFETAPSRSTTSSSSC